MGLTSAINAARLAAGVKPENVVHAHPVEEAGRLHDRIAESSRASKQATLDLCEALTEVIKTGTGTDRGRALLAVEVIDKVRDLGYSDYRMLVGAINSCRDDKSGQRLNELFDDDAQAHRFGALSTRVQEVVSALKHLHAGQFNDRNENLPAPLGHDGIDVGLNERFAEQAMLLLRSVHPLGVNIRNASWRSADGVAEYPAEKLVGLQLGGDQGIDSEPRRDSGALVVKPKGETSVVKFIPYGSRWEDVTESAVINNGESIVVGRGLTLPRDLFGLSLPRSVAVQVDLTIDRENVAWSRGSFFLHRSDDGKSLVIMDRGTRSPVVSPDELGAIQTYIPRTIIDHGTISFGHTMSERPRRLEE